MAICALDLKALSKRCLIFTLLIGLFPNAWAGDAPSPATSMAEFCKKLPRSAYADLQRVALSGDWFEAYRVADGVIAIYEPHQWQEVISYLIVGKKNALLFDTGNGIADIATVVQELTDKPVSVLNSHGHYDHVGGNYAFDKIYGMDSDFTRERQQGRTNEEISVEVSQEALCRALPEGVTPANHSGRPYKVSDFIEDGAVIDLGDRQLEVIHVPGHTPDAIALIDRHAGLMWTGDSYYSGPIWLYAPETDLAAYEQSLDRLIAEVPNLKALLPAHNIARVSPEVLLRVKSGFKAMLAGQARRVESWQGTVVYEFDGEAEFSFLMRDEPLPYK